MPCKTVGDGAPKGATFQEAKSGGVFSRREENPYGDLEAPRLFQYGISVSRDMFNPALNNTQLIPTKLTKSSRSTRRSLPDGRMGPHFYHKPPRGIILHVPPTQRERARSFPDVPQDFYGRSIFLVACILILRVDAITSASGSRCMGHGLNGPEPNARPRGSLHNDRPCTPRP
jgi:hypothetical protein